MDRLQAVSDVWKGAGRDDRHRVLDEALAHLVAELRELKRPAVLIGLAGVGAAASVAKLLLELAVVLVTVLVIIGLDIDVGALVLG